MSSGSSSPTSEHGLVWGDTALAFVGRLRTLPELPRRALSVPRRAPSPRLRSRHASPTPPLRRHQGRRGRPRQVGGPLRRAPHNPRSRGDGPPGHGSVRGEAGRAGAVGLPRWRRGSANHPHARVRRARARGCRGGLHGVAVGGAQCGVGCGEGCLARLLDLPSPVHTQPCAPAGTRVTTSCSSPHATRCVRAYEWDIPVFDPRAPCLERMRLYARQHLPRGPARPHPSPSPLAPRLSLGAVQRRPPERRGGGRLTPPPAPSPRPHAQALFSGDHLSGVEEANSHWKMDGRLFMYDEVRIEKFLGPAGKTSCTARGSPPRPHQKLS